MPTYVSLINWTDHGIKNFRDSTHRAEDFSKLAARSGGTVRNCCGPSVGTTSSPPSVFPTGRRGVAAPLQVGSLGGVRSNTLRAISAAEMSGIIARAR